MKKKQKDIRATRVYIYVVFSDGYEIEREARGPQKINHYRKDVGVVGEIIKKYEI